jgi:hypothetical protein
MRNAARRKRMSLLRLPLALLTLVALTSQFAWGLQQPHFNPVNFFSFFTIASSTFVVMVLLAVVVSNPTHELDVFRGAAVLAVMLVWIVFSFLLSSLESTVLPWVNVVLHYVVPPLMLADWMIDPPQTRLSFPDVLTWLLFPAAYVIYTLLRGSYIGWYPYWFLNPGTVGYFGVLAYCAGIFVLTTGIALVLFLVATGLRAAYRATSRGSERTV